MNLPLLEEVWAGGVNSVVMNGKKLGCLQGVAVEREEQRSEKEVLGFPAWTDKEEPTKSLGRHTEIGGERALPWKPGE